MKKFTSLLVAIVLMLNMMVIMASADATKPTDITNDIKWVTAYDMYANKLPVVRADAIHIWADEYDIGLVQATPGFGIREITFTDWATSGMETYFNDEYFGADGYFAYHG